MSISEPTASASAIDQDPPRVIRRHRLSTRLWHWINAATSSSC